MLWIRQIVWTCLCFTLLNSCKVGKSTIDNTQIKAPAPTVFPYDFDQAKTSNLPKELEEVSGLCYDKVEGHLVAIEDEHGIIYTIDKDNGEILAKNKFYKDGDYEGIATMKNLIYVLKSNGTIYCIEKGKYEEKPVKLKTSSKNDYNFEGLDFDINTNSLLLSSKAVIKGEKKNFRYVYRYDIEKEELSETPFLTISRVELTDYIKRNFSRKEAQQNFKKILDPELDYLHLGPSSVAVHPGTGNIYVLSSQSKSLLVYHGETKVLIYLKKLGKDMLEQPEGMCFDPEGNLYISSEGKKEPAKIIFIPLMR